MENQMEGREVIKSMGSHVLWITRIIRLKYKIVTTLWTVNKLV